MFDPDDLPKAQKDLMKDLSSEDLDPLSLEELALRIEGLQAEIARCEAAMASKSATRSAADALFKS